jgi:hypothetical protein
MARFPLGQPVRIPWNTFQPDGVTLVNATANSLTLKFANADGTTTATAGSPYSAPVNDSTGAYHQDVPAADLATLGHYQWVNTATGTGAGIAFGDFDVFDPYEQAVLPMSDAYAALNINTVAAQQASAAEIGSFVATIQSCIERMTAGPLINRTVVERCEMTTSQSVIVVRQRPLVSVTSIVSVASGTTVDISGGLDIDVNAGTVRRQLPGWPFILPVFAWLPIVKVTYVAGWGVTVPAAFNKAASIILQNLWTTQHGPSQRPSMGPMGAGEMVTMPGFGFAIPNQAAELLNGSQAGVPFIAEAYF